MNEKKIMSYPFTGFDYRQIMEIGSKVRIVFNENGCDTFYIVSYNDSKFGMRQEERIDIVNDNLKSMLFYFKFLNDMCRVRPIPKGDESISYSYNTYIDVILISINEIVSSCKKNGINPDYNEALARFGKQYNPDDLSKLYSSASEYEYLTDLFNYLYEDSYLVHASKFNDSGVYFNKINDGSLDEIVREIIDNKDDSEFFSSSRKKVCGPKLTKKIDYRVSVY